MELEKSILMSIKKEWCDLIKSGEKTIEWRKTIPKNIMFPCTCFIYETKSNGGCGMIIGEFKFISYSYLSKEEYLMTREDVICKDIFDEIINQGCVLLEELDEYSKGKHLYAIEIENLKIYNEPKPLETLWADENHPIELAPQSWRYCYKEIE